MEQNAYLNRSGEGIFYPIKRVKNIDGIERKTSPPELLLENSFRKWVLGGHAEGDVKVDLATAALILLIADRAVEPERDAIVIGRRFPDVG